MFSAFLFLVSSAFSISTVSSSALPSPLNVISSSLNQPTVFETSNTNNKSLQDLTVPLSTYSPDCSVSYGGNLDLASCDNALAKISQFTTPMTFGERGTGTWDVVLPRRYLSDDGQCAIDVKVDLNEAQGDVSNYLQINDAASAIIDDCVQTRLPSTGGVVKYLGIRYRSLSVEVIRYLPTVECQDEVTSAPPSYDSCNEILDTMQWSLRLTRFGLPWQTGIQVQLPYFLISADRQCKLIMASKLSREPPVEIATWANVWSAAVAVNEMCVKDGRGGHASPQSLHGSLVLFLFGPGSGPTPEMFSSLNMSSSGLSMLSAFNTTPPITIS